MNFDIIMNEKPEIELFLDGRLVATLHLDYFYQTDCVTLQMGTSSEDERLHALQVAVTHVQHYCIRRSAPIFGGLMVSDYGPGFRSLKDSLAAVTAFDVDAQISACSAAQLTNELCKLGISVAEAVHTTAIAALTEAMNDPRLDHKVSFKVSNNDRSDDLLVKFTAKDASFKFWHTMSRPGSGMDLDIVPGYHPVMYGRTYDFLINGDTDALIGAKAVRYVYPPDSAKGPRDDTYLSSRWVNIDHPVFVQGQSFEAVVIPRHIVTEEGLETLVKLLSDAMSSNGNYVGVCGGFRSSLPYPSNVLSQLRTLPPRGEARGSEGRCVWTYRTLVKEGALQNAYVPRWFVDEGWLQAYAVDTDH